MSGEQESTIKVVSIMHGLSGYGVEVSQRAITIRLPSNEAVTVKSDATVIVFDAASDEVARYNRGEFIALPNRQGFRFLQLVDGFWAILSGYNVQVSFGENRANLIVSEGGNDWWDEGWHVALQVTVEWVVQR